MSEKKSQKKFKNIVRTVLTWPQKKWIPINNPKSDIKGFTKVIVELRIMYFFTATKKIHVFETRMHKHKAEFRFATEVFGKLNDNKSYSMEEFKAEMLRMFRPYGWRIIQKTLLEVEQQHFTKKKGK